MPAHTAVALIPSLLSKSAYPSALQGSPRALAPPLLHRLGVSGLGRIRGTTAIKGTPANLLVRRRVVLIRERDAVCVGEVWSAEGTGYYEFNSIDANAKYSAILYDGPRVFKAAVQDAITPEPAA